MNLTELTFKPQRLARCMGNAEFQYYMIFKNSDGASVLWTFLHEF